MFCSSLLMIHMTFGKKALWFLGALSVFAALVAGSSIFWFLRNEPSPREWKFSPLWSETEKEQILMVADYMERHGPERFLLRSLSPNSRHIDWHLFSEFSMSQYMKDEIRERLQMIRETAENGDGRCRSSHHESLLHLAAGLGHVQLLNRLLQMNADPNLQIIMSPQAAQLLNGSELGDTPMTYACCPGLGDGAPLPVGNRLTCLSLLIRNGASVDKIGPAGWPPLVMSCVAGIGGAPYEETALLLLKHGADISICPELRGKKTSLLSWAVAASYPNVVRKLCEAGYDPNFRGEMSPPLLCLNLHAPDTALRITQILIQYGADVNAAMPVDTAPPDSAGDTALLNLCRQLGAIDEELLPQMRELVNLLINEGADVNHQNSVGETPLMLCCRDMLLGDGTLDTVKLGIARLLLGPERQGVPAGQIWPHRPPANRQPGKRTHPHGAEKPAGIERFPLYPPGSPLKTFPFHMERRFSPCLRRSSVLRQLPESAAGHFPSAAEKPFFRILGSPPPCGNGAAPPRSPPRSGFPARRRITSRARLPYPAAPRNQAWTRC